MDRKVKPNSSKTGTTIVLALLTFLVCAFASVFLAAYHRTTIDTVVSLWRSFRAPPAVTLHTPPPEQSQMRIEKPLPLKRLLDNSKIAFETGDFSLADKFAKTDFCELVQPVFLGHAPRWETSPFDSGATYCIGQLEEAPTEGSAIGNSLFLQIRRNAYGAATMVRLKIVYRQERMQKAFTREFQESATIILRQLFLEDQPDIMANIKALLPFEFVRLGIRIKLFEEQLIPGAYNLMIEARCGKYDCPAVSPYYRMALIRKNGAPESPVEQGLSEAQ